MSGELAEEIVALAETFDPYDDDEFNEKESGSPQGGEGEATARLVAELASDGMEAVLRDITKGRPENPGPTFVGSVWHGYAELIVKAVNSYDAMRGALIAIRNTGQIMLTTDNEGAHSFIRFATKAARDALEGESQ